MDRREFLKGASAFGCCAAAGCRTASQDGFYGETVRDRLWMWGHHIDCWKRTKGWPGPSVDQADGCQAMGIPNVCVIRFCNLPRYPWGDYFEQFRRMKRFSFGITDGAVGSVREKMRIAFEELKPAFPNFTGCFLDDYFRPADLGQDSIRIFDTMDRAC